MIVRRKYIYFSNLLLSGKVLFTDSSQLFFFFQSIWINSYSLFLSVNISSDASRLSGKSKASVLVCSGCYNKVPQRGWLKNNKNLFQNSGGWKSKLLEHKLSCDSYKDRNPFHEVSNLMLYSNPSSSPPPNTSEGRISTY